MAPVPALAQPVAEARVAALARGVNATNWWRYPARHAPDHFTHYLRDADLATLRRAGFTFIRLPVDPPQIADASGRVNPTRLAWLLTAIGRINQAGLAVVVEPHPPNSHPVEGNPAPLLALWEGLAPALARTDPDKVFLELFSEPIYDQNEAAWFALQERLAALVRARAPRHTIIATGANWSSLAGLERLTPLADRNVIYTFHFYVPMVFTHQGSTWTSAALRSVQNLRWPAGDAADCIAAVPPPSEPRGLQMAQAFCRQGWDFAQLRREVGRAEAWARRHGVPVFAGEFGAGCFNPDRASRLRWFADARRAFEEAGMGWAIWGLDNCMGFGAKPAEGPVVLAPDILAALGLPKRL
jgi:hypothetical protein